MLWFTHLYITRKPHGDTVTAATTFGEVFIRKNRVRCVYLLCISPLRASSCTVTLIIIRTLNYILYHYSVSDIKQATSLVKGGGQLVKKDRKTSSETVMWMIKHKIVSIGPFSIYLVHCAFATSVFVRCTTTFLGNII